MSDNFSIQNGLKQCDALLELLFNFALECAIRKVQENQVILRLVQNISCSHLLSKEVKIRIYKTNFCLWFCMGMKHSL
jgi:hypothetical protein